MVRAANAIAAFEATAFRSDDSPFDRWLAGDQHALNAAQRRGFDLFYGSASCVDCHSGKFQSDQDFHSIAMPQIGPGKSDGHDGSYWRASGHKGFVEDYGRGRVTFNVKMTRFKIQNTITAKCSALTGPWGHAGAFDRLEDIVRHHANSVASLEQYRPVARHVAAQSNRVVQLTAVRSNLLKEWMPQSRVGWVPDARYLGGRRISKLRQLIAETNEIEPMELSDT